jgi:hypothetical protein
LSVPPPPESSLTGGICKVAGPLAVVGYWAPRALAWRDGQYSDDEFKTDLGVAAIPFVGLPAALVGWWATTRDSVGGLKDFLSRNATTAAETIIGTDMSWTGVTIRFTMAPIAAPVNFIRSIL